MSEQQQQTELSKQRSQLSFFQSDAGFSQFFPFAGASRWNDHGNHHIMRCWDGKWGGTNVPCTWDQEVILNGVMSARPITRILSVKSEKWKKRIHIPLRWGIFVITFIPSWIGTLAWKLNIGDKNSADIYVMDWNSTLLLGFQKLETWTHQTSEAIVTPCFMPSDLWPLMIHNDTCIWFEFQTKVHQGHNQEVNLMSACETYPICHCASGARKCR